MSERTSAVTATKSLGAKAMSARAIFETSMKPGLWGYGAKTPNRAELRKGDRVVLHVGRQSTGQLELQCQPQHD